MTTISIPQLQEIAEQYINILTTDPQIEYRKGEIADEIHFIYPLSAIAGNAVDGNSLAAMQGAVSREFGRGVGTFWVGIYGDRQNLHIWATVRH